MRLLELEEKILDYIRTYYKANYNGRLEVDNDDGIFTFIIGVPSYMAPTTVSLATDDADEFLDFIKKELRERNYMRIYSYKVNRNNETRE